MANNRREFANSKENSLENQGAKRNNKYNERVKHAERAEHEQSRSKANYAQNFGAQRSQTNQHSQTQNTSKSHNKYDKYQTAKNDTKPLVSLILPAYNEEAILAANTAALVKYTKTLEHKYQFELIVINDGSKDKTGIIADQLAQQHHNLKAFHHPTNYGLGRVLVNGFKHARGELIVTLDIDLSYAPHHIEELLDKLIRSHADMVLASPYMPGGQISNVPWLRRHLSISANKFLARLSKHRSSTLTCMVRAYRASFIKSLNLRSTDMALMPETIYKSMVVGAHIEQIPAHLDWGKQNKAGASRRSSMQIFKQILGVLLTGFIFRPFIFFIMPGLLLLGFAAYVNTWMVIHVFNYHQQLTELVGMERVTNALATAYQAFPHTFIVGLLALMLALQLIGLGMQTLQSKHYFEELFTHLHNNQNNHHQS